MKKNKTTHFSASILIIVFTAVFLVLMGRFMYIQATGEVQGVSLEDYAKQKRTSAYVLESERGKIFDNNGMVLAYDMPVYRLYAILDEAYSDGLREKKHVVDPVETANKLAPILEIEESEILDTIQKGIENDRFQVEFGNAGKNLSKEKRDQILELNLPGINFEEDSLRYYPNGVFASQIIGFAREEEVEKEDGETTKEMIGITGMEKEMNDILKGANGYISYQRDRYNNKLLDPNEVIKQPQDGDNVYLTIDQKIQTIVEDVLTQVEEEYNPERVTAVIMDPETGEVLALGNRPSYNPNNPENVENWYNDVISSPFEPGSTMKMFTWAAAIEEGVYNGDEHFESGSYRANERLNVIHDYNDVGWGSISYDEGFIRSSNVATAKLVWEKLGTEKYLDYLKAFDFDKTTGIDLPGESAGKILYNWPQEKISTGFGQGSIFTPIQLLKASTAIANDGKMVQPFVIKKVVDSSTNKVLEEKETEVVAEPISEETASKVLELLSGAVNNEKGTGTKFQLEDYTAGGKTGTAQIPNPNGGGYLSGRGNYIFSFLGMAPIEDPQLVMYVSVKQPELENDQSGSDPVSFIFKNVMENSLHYLNIETDNEEESEIESFEMPKIIGSDVKATTSKLKELHLNYTVVGKGEKVVATNIKEGDTVLPQERIFIITDKPTMPNTLGWSLRDIHQFSSLLELKLETFGNGYVVMQTIDKGTPLKKGDYLGVELENPTLNEQKPKEEKANIEDKEANQSD